MFLCFTCTFIQAQQAEDQAQQEAEDLVNSGNMKASQKKFADAITDYNAAIELEPKYGMAYLYRRPRKSSTQQLQRGNN